MILRVGIASGALLILVLLLGLSGPAAGEVEAPLVGQETSLDAAAQYAGEFGLSTEEAELRLEQQIVVADLDQRLRDALGTAYGGVELVHAPMLKVRVLVPPIANAGVVSAVAKELAPDLVIEQVSVDYSESEIITRLHEAVTALRAGGVSSGDAFGDILQQRVTVQVTADKVAFAALIAEDVEVAKAGPPILVQRVDALLEPSTSGGQDAGGCMVALTVRKIVDSRLGVVTAEHCDGALTHPELGSLTYVAPAVFDDTYDAELAVASTANADYDDLVRTVGTTTDSIDAVGGNAVLGELQCHRGDDDQNGNDSNGIANAPTYSCAYAYTNSYCPLGSPGCDSNELSTDGHFVLVLDPNERVSDPGDSGGPWVRPVSTLAAMGVHSGGSPTRNAAFANVQFAGITCPGNGCWNASFTAAHWLDDAPVSLQVLTSTPPSCNGLQVTHWGTASANTINGTSAADVINAGDGNDTINGNGGADVICSGSGNDTINGGSGNDTILSGAGTDIIDGGTGTDTCNGGTESDFAKNCQSLSSIESGIGSFFDDDESVHVADIEWIAAEGITTGCGTNLYCPADDTTRAHIAGFLYNAYHGAQYFENPPGSYNPFTDDSGPLEGAIEWMAYNGITSGCNPPTNNNYCPNDNVTREQVAVFLTRAYRTSVNLPPNSGLPSPPWSFSDIGGTTAPYIQYIKNLSITNGCNPPTNTLFCPTAPATREQMATFLRNLLD